MAKLKFTLARPIDVYAEILKMQFDLAQAEALLNRKVAHLNDGEMAEYVHQTQALDLTAEQACVAIQGSTMNNDSARIYFRNVIQTKHLDLIRQ